VASAAADALDTNSLRASIEAQDSGGRSTGASEDASLRAALWLRLESLASTLHVTSMQVRQGSCFSFVYAYLDKCVSDLELATRADEEKRSSEP
jgi:hypothetical protein